MMLTEIFGGVVGGDVPNKRVTKNTDEAVKHSHSSHTKIHHE